MKRTQLLVTILLLGLTATCGFGFGDDLGTPTPPAGYWGWLCADGTTPDPQAGCLPQTCDDNSTPALQADGGLECVCVDGTDVLVSTCCDDASTPTFETSDAGQECVCADGTDVPACNMGDAGS